MFDFINDMGNYADRKVGRDDFDWGFISTARVSDGREPFETAVEHTDYNGGKMVIVACYPTKKAAKEGHAEWKEKMTAKRLPKSLTDCSNSQLQQLCDALSQEKSTYPRIRK